MLKKQKLLFNTLMNLLYQALDKPNPAYFLKQEQLNTQIT